MKKIMVLLFLTALFVACGSQNEKSSSQNSQQEQVSIDPANLEITKLAVFGMTCGGCERTVTTTVGKLAGVDKVVASHKDSTVTITFDKTQANLEEIKAAIEDKGYQVKD